MKSSIKLPFRPYQFAVFLILLTGLWYLLIQLLLQFKNSDPFLRQQLDWSGAALVTLLALSGGVTIYRLYRQRKQIQSALINSERQQRERIERLPIGFFRTSPDGMLVAVNETLVQMAGAAGREDLLQRKVSEFSLIAQPQNDWFARLGTQDEAVNFFALTHRLSGDEVWVRVNARAVKDERQRVVAIEGTVEDFDAHLRAEAALRQTQAQLSAIFNAGPHSLILYDRDFRILAFNQPAENWVRAMTGRQIEKGEAVFTCIDPLLLDQFGESSERALRGEAVIAEKYCRPADGRGTWLQTHFSRVDDEQGELMGVLFAVYDLTEQKAAKEETRQTTASLEAFFNSSADSLLLLDPDLRVMAINRMSKVRTSLLLGHELKVGENLLTIIPAKYREKFQQDFYTALNGTPTHDQQQYEFANGSCWFDLTLSPVRCETGAITGVCFLARDITTEKQVLDQLHLLNEQHTRLLETAPVGIITIDQGGRILYANSAIERILRLPKEVICQRTIEDPAWHLTDRSGNEISIADTPFLRVKNQGETVFGAEYAIPHEDGTCTQVSVNAAPLHDSGGGISGMVAAVTDVTERDETRRLLQLQLQRIAALRSIDRAITTRSPLTGIIHQILQQTVEQLGVDAAVLFLMDPDRQQLRCTASLGLGEPDGCGHVIDLQDPGVGELLSRRGVHRVTGIEEIIPLLKRAAPACQETFAEYIGISLVVKDEVIGVFEAFTRQPATRKADWIEYFRTLSGQMAVALDSDRLY
ncbi:MAG TPA: PAS domain S-box protein, partial [Anaerolineaceae bacterium]|nr:PAS domain S-box protein [Anaerolineaceae bacterium]